MKEFKEAWLSTVDKKGSILCAGVDPADYVMGRTEKGEGLPAGVDKEEWALKYVEAVAPYAAGIKPNMRYWGRRGDLGIVEKIIECAHNKGLVVIQDSKEPDIGSTNDAGIFYGAVRGADALTLSPFPGNMEEAAKQGIDRGIGLISMCLMSNPEYKREKNMWVDISKDTKGYFSEDIKEIEGAPHVRRYIQLARDAAMFGLAGVLIGAPSAKNHLKDEEVKNVGRYYPNGLVLVPGIGAQRGEVSVLTKFFDIKHIIANVGRALMFPNGAYSTPQEQAETAKQYMEMLRGLK